MTDSTENTVTLDSKVEIPCPRCGGQGHGGWEPDSGLCYRCKGACKVTIDVGTYVRALCAKRAEYRRLRKTGADPERLAEVEVAGTRIKAELAATGADIEALVEMWRTRKDEAKPRKAAKKTAKKRASRRRGTRRPRGDEQEALYLESLQD